MTWDWELKGIGSCFGGEGKKRGGGGSGRELFLLHGSSIFWSIFQVRLGVTALVG